MRKLNVTMFMDRLGAVRGCSTAEARSAGETSSNAAGEDHWSHDFRIFEVWIGNQLVALGQRHRDDLQQSA